LKLMSRAGVNLRAAFHVVRALDPMPAQRPRAAEYLTEGGDRGIPYPSLNALLVTGLEMGISILCPRYPHNFESVEHPKSLTDT
jgi:hypothetical protein